MREYRRVWSSVPPSDSGRIHGCVPGVGSKADSFAELLIPGVSLRY